MSLAFLSGNGTQPFLPGSEQARTSCRGRSTVFILHSGANAGVGWAQGVPVALGEKLESLGRLVFQLA